MNDTKLEKLLEKKFGKKLDRIERLIVSNKKVLSFTEGCEYSGLTKGYMYKLTSLGLIPFSKPNGKLVFFEKEKLDDWLLQNKSKSKAEIESEAVNRVYLK